jgi:hypothetical protein
MFLLTEAELSSAISLKNISVIDVLFYKSRNESINIFNLELDFYEDIIPLITSTLECKPILTHRKKYIGLDNDYIIDIPINNNHDINKGATITAGTAGTAGTTGTIGNSNSSVRDPRGISFYLDIEAFNKNSSGQRSYWQSHKLHYSNVYSKSQEIVRVYSRDEATPNIFNPQDVFGTKEEYVITWHASWGGFEICINPQRKACIWRLVINVIEEHQFIDSKVDEVNTWLEKIHKLKSTIKIAKDTNLETSYTEFSDLENATN